MQGDALLPLLNVVGVPPQKNLIDEERSPIHELLEPLHALVHLLLIALDVLLVRLRQAVHEARDVALGELGVRVEDLGKVAQGEDGANPFLERGGREVELALLDPVRRESRPQPAGLIAVDGDPLRADDALDVEEEGRGRVARRVVRLGRRTRISNLDDLVPLRLLLLVLPLPVLPLPPQPLALLPRHSRLLGILFAHLEPFAEQLVRRLAFGILVRPCCCAAGEAEEELGCFERAGRVEGEEKVDVVVRRSGVDLWSCPY